MTEVDPYWKYEHLIRDPKEIVVREHTDPWYGAEIVVEQETNTGSTHGLSLTVEEAFTLRDALDAYLEATYS